MKQLLVGFCLIAGSCTSSGDMTEEEKAIVIAEVKETLNNYYFDINQSGLTAEFRYLDNSKDFFWVPPGFGHAISYDSVAAILRRSAPLFKSIENKFDTLRIIPLSRNVATYTARLTSKMVDTTGLVTEVNLVETGTMIKRESEWKLSSGQTSHAKN